MADLFTAQNLVALLTLLALEIVLGVDNVIFISILASRLPAHQRARARTIGITLAVVTRVLLLLSITFIMGLTAPVVTIFGNGLSWRDLILIVGGLFLIAKSVHEIHDKLEASEHVEGRAGTGAASFNGVIIQIVLMDIIFSLDSVITAVGISGELPIMITAVVIAAGVMVVFAGVIGDFVEKHPTMKILALSFLIMIGAVLVIEGWNAEAAHALHIKNYVYFSMAFAFVIQLLNMRLRPSPEPVRLKNHPSMKTAMLPETNIEMAGDIY
jgi:predicted tellurium resistance membrane protein TerC